MSTDSTFKCSRCRVYRVSNQFGTHVKGGIQGWKGDRLKVCLTCSTEAMTNKKRKHLESKAYPPMKQITMPPALSPSQFVAALAECASAPKIKSKLHVSLTEMTISGKGAADHIASLAWKVTGYRFTYAVPSTFACRLWCSFILP